MMTVKIQLFPFTNIPLNSAYQNFEMSFFWFLKNMLMYLKCSWIVLEYFYKNDVSIYAYICIQKNNVGIFSSYVNGESKGYKVV